MKTKNPLFRPLLLAGIGLALARQLAAQPFTALHSFAELDLGVQTNSGGATPQGCVLSGTTLYGTAGGGGRWGSGTLFSINIEDMSFTTLYDFSAIQGYLFIQFMPYGTNHDGAEPRAVILSDNTIYGTTWAGGSHGFGTLFKINARGIGFTSLHSFIGNDGAFPQPRLILSSNTLYGVTTIGGSDSVPHGSGNIFALNTDGSHFRILHTFTSANNYGTNSDGAQPSGLALSDNILYGTTLVGGAAGPGTVFALNRIRLRRRS